MKDKQVITIGLAGFGTVGTGLLKILEANEDWIYRRIGKKIKIKKILVKDINKKREFLPPPEVKFTSKVEDIVGDPEVDIVVELIGGKEVAKQVIVGALDNKKCVVTANKALLAEDGKELFDLAQKNGCALFYEASVGGGIPIVQTLKENLASNKIKLITGILNGTANYILSEMSNKGISFKEALSKAQELGYAEADPTFDIEGIDAAHKLVLLIQLAFGFIYPFKELFVEGISDVESYDIKMAKEFGYEIKLIAQVKEKSSFLQAGVFPALVKKDHMLAKVDGPFNAVLIEGNAVGPIMLYGQGAGDLPTGSSVLSDIMAIIRTSRPPYNNTGFINTDSSYRVLKEDLTVWKHYFRFNLLDKPGVLSIISGIMGERNISIAQVVQKEERNDGYVPAVFLTHSAQTKDVLSALKEINKLNFVREPSKHFRIL